jgi:hypothetical protein
MIINRNQQKSEMAKRILAYFIFFVAIFAEPALTSAQNLLFEGTTTISFKSIPESVEIYIDSIFIGSSPCQYQTIPKKFHSITYRKNGFCSRTDTLAIHSSVDTTIFVHLYKPAAVYLTSTPDSAVVYISQKFAGHTPLFLSNLSQDTLMITISKRLCESWRTSIIPKEDDTTKICAQLVNRSTTMNIFVHPSNAQVFIDDKFASMGNLIEFNTSEGPHKITVRDDITGHKQDLLTDTKAGMLHSYRAKFGVNSIRRGFFAAIIPGSSQIIDGAYLKGTAMFFGSITLGYYAIQSQSDYKSRRDEYDSALRNYITASTEDEAFRRHDDVEIRKSDLDKYYARRTVSLALFAACYIYSLADGLLNHLTTDYIEVIPLSEVQAAPDLPSTGHSTGAQIKVKF